MLGRDAEVCLCAAYLGHGVCRTICHRGWDLLDLKNHQAAGSTGALSELADLFFRSLAVSKAPRMGSQNAKDAWNLLDWANMILLLIGFTMRMLLFSDACPAS